MCVASMISDSWTNNLPNTYPNAYPLLYVNRYEFDAQVKKNEALQKEVDTLKKDLEELRELMKAAQKYDEATGQKDCEQEEKIATFKKLADLLGIDLTGMFNK